jgi:hypothetical protein
MDSVSHFEIPAKDPTKTADFYTKAFGWKVEAVPGMDYWMVWTTESDPKTGPKKPGAINGGIWKGERNDRPIIVITVKNIDEHVKKVQKAGGKVVMEKTPVGDMGLYARFQDPDGNILGLWQNA